MKISLIFQGKHPLSLFAFSFLLLSCQPEEYFDINTLVAGNDAICSRAQDRQSCEAQPKCQPAFEDMESDLETPVFSACIANPPEAPQREPDIEDENLPGDETSPGNDNDPDFIGPDRPTLDDAILANCQNLDDQYLYIMHVMETRSQGGSKKTTTKRQVKVKVCHQTGNLSAHTIIIACPALRAHVNDHDDYLGACEKEAK